MPKHAATYLLGRDLRQGFDHLADAARSLVRFFASPCRRSFWRDLRQGWRDAGGG